MKIFDKTLEQHAYEFADDSFGLFKLIVLIPIRIFIPDFGMTPEQLKYEADLKKQLEEPSTKGEKWIMIILYVLASIVVGIPYFHLLGH